VTPLRRRLLAAGAAAACAALGGWVAWQRTALTDSGEAASALLYAQTLPDAAGRPFELASLKGRTVVLNFWATWCPPCVDEMPELSGLHGEIVGRNATVIGIGVDSPSNVREFAQKHRFAYPLLVAGLTGSELARQFGNTSAALPFTVVIDPSGRVVERRLGRIRLPQLRRIVLETLG
jgi:peroxiredoxin